MLANTFWEVHQKNTPERVFFCAVDVEGFSCCKHVLGSPPKEHTRKGVFYKGNTLSKSSGARLFCCKFVGLNLTGKVISLLLSTFFAKALVLD